VLSCFADLLSSKEPQKVEAALKAADSLVRTQPSDLSEVQRCETWITELHSQHDIGVSVLGCLMP